MPQIFKTKQFTDYLGENRAILDTVTDFFSISPTPSPTTTSSPTPTPTPTPTPSPIPEFNIGYGFDATAQCILIDSSDNIFVAGLFNGYNSEPSYSMVKLDTTGAIDLTFAAGLNFLKPNLNINKITEDETGNYVYIYGAFTTPSQRIAKIDKTTGLNVWSGLTLFTSGGQVHDVAVDPSNGDVYCVGAFTAVQGQTRNRICRFDKNGTLQADFSGTAFNNTVNQIFFNTNGNLICTGTFTTYFGVTSTRIIEIDFATKTKTALWGSGQTGGGNLISAYQNTSNGEYYIVGNPSYTLNSGSPGYIGKWDVNGTYIAFSTSGIPVAIPIGLYYDQVNNYMYLGNTAANYGGNGIIRVDMTTGNVDSTFTTNIGTYNPNTQSASPLNNTIALDSSNRIYRVGNFVLVNTNVQYNRIIRYLQSGVINTNNDAN